jgi:hypothetical protein
MGDKSQLERIMDLEEAVREIRWRMDVQTDTRFPMGDVACVPIVIPDVPRHKPFTIRSTK